MTRQRRFAWIAGSLVALFLLAAIAGVFVLQSDWFFNQVRLKLTATIEKATGGRVEIGAFRFDWRQLHAEVRDLVVHGTEPAGKPPLLRASRVAAGLKLVSISRRDVDIQFLEVAEPRVYLIIAADGRTNVPQPKVKSTGSTIQDILDVAIGRFDLERGLVEVEDHEPIPFSARGENLLVQLAYDVRGPRYTGNIAINPLHLGYDDYGPEPFQVNLAVAMEHNRITLSSGKLTSGGIQVDVAGAIDDLVAPHAGFQYTARASLTDIRRIFRVPELRQGSGVVTGRGVWDPASGVSIAGTLHAAGVEYRDSTIRLAGFRAEGAVSVNSQGVDADNLAISGNYVHDRRSERIDGRIGRVALRHKDLDLRQIALTLLSGSFRGDATVRGMDRYTVDGAISGLDARRAASLYVADTLPWDALAFGAVAVSGSFHRPQDVRASGKLTVAPAPGSDPVTGEINAVYEARGGGNLDLGRSTLQLPNTRADLSGSIGHELKVHLETHDFNDVLPALGESASAIPVKLNKGSVVFEGSVTGNLANPRVAGHVRGTSIAYGDEVLDAFESDVQLSADYLRVQNAAASRGAVRARIQGSLGLSSWNVADDSPVSATATLTDAAAADILTLAQARDIPLTGTIAGSVQANGTLGRIAIQGDVSAAKGAWQNEPFDRFGAHFTYSGDRLDVSAAQLVAGAKQLKLNVDYQHAPGQYAQGRLRFQVSSNSMPVEQIHWIAEQRSDLKGTLELTASGDVDLTPRAATPYRIQDIHADIAVRQIQFANQRVGEARLTANSQAGVLRAHIDSTIAGSTVRGDGQWRLEGEYPGTAAIQFSKIDLARLKDWLSPGEEDPGFTGSAEGELRLDLPAERPKALKAELRIREFQIASAPIAGINAPPPTVRNSGDIVFRYANSVLVPESAHFVGPGTDLQLTGRIQPDQKVPLDLRADGRLDLGFLHDFFPDFVASGAVNLSAAMRGTYVDPQITGRMEFQKATFNIADVPNGIANASGVIVFNKDRATIQRFAGETGGGKIELTGFAGYGGVHTTVFRLHARATEVRVRYPEGVSTVVNANLNLTGTSDSSMLSGSVTVLRTGFNLQSDFSSILAKSAEPVRTPSARTGLLGGMGFDVQIDTSPDLLLQSTLAEDVQMEANLKLRGTATNPAVLGRISITQGKVSFFGTQFTLNQGTIAFYNPVRIEPILDVDLETKARGIDVILTISGPLSKLTLTPRSDPPLQFSEIVALLATGRTPMSDPSLWSQQSNSQTWSQMGASALLGSAIANPVAGRLQRFFGVSKLRIDPTITGVENNPQARVTLEQQVTPSLTFTYITNVTTSNPQVIRIEWAFSRQWSAVALREENGLFGIDFYYKRRFK